MNFTILLNFENGSPNFEKLLYDFILYCAKKIFVTIPLSPPVEDSQGMMAWRYLEDSVRKVTWRYPQDSIRIVKKKH